MRWNSCLKNSDSVYCRLLLVNHIINICSNSGNFWKFISATSSYSVFLRRKYGTVKWLVEKKIVVVCQMTSQNFLSYCFLWLLCCHAASAPSKPSGWHIFVCQAPPILWKCHFFFRKIKFLAYFSLINLLKSHS